MTTWYPIVTAPKDGTPIQAKIPGHGSDNIIAWQGGLLDGGDRECGGWHFIEDQEPPGCWTDGICWEVNEDGVASVQPTHWTDLPDPSPVDEAPAAPPVGAVGPSSGRVAHPSRPGERRGA